MSQLVLATANPATPSAPHAQWAHDIRNALATVGLATMRNEAMAQSARADPREIFRILFNLVRNAITVARNAGNCGKMTCVTLLVERAGDALAWPPRRELGQSGAAFRNARANASRSLAPRSDTAQ